MRSIDPQVSGPLKQTIATLSEAPAAIFRLLENIVRLGGWLPLRVSTLVTEAVTMQASGMGPGLGGVYVHLIEEGGPVEQALLSPAGEQALRELAATYPSVTGTGSVLLLSLLVFVVGDQIRGFMFGTKEDVDSVKNDTNFRSRNGSSASAEQATWNVSKKFDPKLG